MWSLVSGIRLCLAGARDHTRAPYLASLLYALVALPAAGQAAHNASMPSTSSLVALLCSFFLPAPQCYACGNPETVVKVKKENILLKCKACGFVSDVDPRLKLNGYIVKNPPEVKLSKGEKK